MLVMQQGLMATVGAVVVAAAGTLVATVSRAAIPTRIFSYLATRS